MRYAVAASALLLALGFLPATAAAVDPWQEWLKELHQQCPSKHVDWVEDGGYDDLIGDFLKTIPKETQSKVIATADYSHRCGPETEGFSCEMGAYLTAFHKLGLLRQFTAFGCQTRSCSDIALCRRTSN